MSDPLSDAVPTLMPVAEELILTFEQALDAISDGVDDWDELTWRLPRNDLPAVLAEIALWLNPGQLARALTDAWVMCEFPEQAVGREQWLGWFREVGYIVNGEPAKAPEQVTLYRGGVFADRMAWTGCQSIAEWFRDRWPNGKLWTATVQADRLLAHFNNVRLEESGRVETEYVIDPSGLAVEELRP
jgi:hypothetical protein